MSEVSRVEERAQLGSKLRRGAFAAEGPNSWKELLQRYSAKHSLFKVEESKLPKEKSHDAWVAAAADVSFPFVAKKTVKDFCREGFYSIRSIERFLGYIPHTDCLFRSGTFGRRLLGLTKNIQLKVLGECKRPRDMQSILASLQHLASRRSCLSQHNRRSYKPQGTYQYPRFAQ